MRSSVKKLLTAGVVIALAVVGTAAPAAAVLHHAPIATEGCVKGPGSECSLIPLRWQREALATAEAFWHPSCGPLTLSFGEPVIGSVVRDDPEGAGEVVTNAAAWTALGSCHIEVLRTLELEGYPPFCTLILHEAGHSAGFPDTDSGLMSYHAWYGRAAYTWLQHGHRYQRMHWGGVNRHCIRPRDIRLRKLS